MPGQWHQTTISHSVTFVHVVQDINPTNCDTIGRCYIVLTQWDAIPLGGEYNIPLSHVIPFYTRYWTNEPTAYVIQAQAAMKISTDKCRSLIVQYIPITRSLALHEVFRCYTTIRHGRMSSIRLQFWEIRGFGPCWFEPWSSQTNDLNIVTCHFLARRSALLG